MAMTNWSGMRHWMAWGLAAICLFHAGNLLFKIATFYPDYINSDAAVAPLLATEVLRSGQLVPDGWYHANSDVWLFSRHFLILPFVAMLGIGQASYLAMQIAFVTLLAISAAWLLRPIIRKPLHLFIAVSMLAIPTSYHQFDMVFGEVAYGPILLQMILVGGLLVRACLSSAIWSWSLAFLFVMCLLFAAANPSRYIACVLVPAFVVLYLFHGLKQRTLVIGLVLGIALVVGFGLHQHFTNDLYQSYLGRRIALSNPLLWPWYFAISLAEIYLLIDLKSLQTEAGLLRTIASYMFGTVVWILLLHGGQVLGKRFFHHPKPVWQIASKWRYRYLLLLFYLASVASIAGALVVTKAPIGGRIFLPSVFPILLVIFGIFVPQALRSRRVAGLYLMVFLVPLLFLMTSQRPVERSLKRELGIAEKILDLGLQFGYSTDFWHANVVTLVTSEKVKVRALNLKDGRLRPYRWLSKRDWYLQRHNGRFFVISELEDSIDFSKLERLGVNLVKTVPHRRWNIHVFDGHSHLQKLPNWTGNDRLLQDNSLYTESEIGVLHQTREESYLEGRVPGVLFSGPYRPLRKGVYRLNVEVSCSPGALANARLYDKRGSLSIALGEVCNGSRAAIPVSLTKNMRRAAVQLNVQSGIVRFYRFELR